MADRDPQPASSAPLATNRPWLAVAGCLGGGTLAIGAAMLLLVAAVLLLVLVPDILSPSHQQKATFISALGKLTEAPALKVATREIAVRVEVSLPSEVFVGPLPLAVAFGWKAEVGRTTVRIESDGNAVQYIIPLDRIGDDGAGSGAISVGGKAKRAEITWELGDVNSEAVVTLPPPRVDESLVDIKRDPEHLRIDIDRDWAAHLLRDDRARETALAAIRSAVVREASSEIAMFEVREKARATVVEMFRALLPDQLRDRPIRVRWSDEPR